MSDVMPDPPVETANAPTDRWERKRRMALDFTREQWAWAFVDVGIFGWSSALMGSYGALYYKQIVGNGMPNDHLPAIYWSYTSAASMTLGSVVSPLVGAICDAQGKRKLILNLSLLLCYISTLMFILPGVGVLHHENGRFATVIWASGFVALSSLTFMVCQALYNSLLMFVSRPDELHRVSAFGSGMSNLGAALIVGIVMASVRIGRTKEEGKSIDASELTVVYILSVCWSMMFTLPAWPFLPSDRAPPKKEGLPGHATMSIRSRMWHHVQRFRNMTTELRGYNDLLLFMVSSFFYSDGIGTVWQILVIYASSLGISKNDVLGSAVLNRLCGCLFSWMWGILVLRVAPIRCFIAVILLSIGAVALLAVLSQPWEYWLLSVLLAAVGSGGFTLSRSILALLVPQARAAEFFGYAAVVCRVAGVLGPLTYSAIGHVTGSLRLAFMGPIGFFVIALAGTCFTNIERGHFRAQQSLLSGASSTTDQDPDQPLLADSADYHGRGGNLGSSTPRTHELPELGVPELLTRRTLSPSAENVNF